MATEGIVFKKIDYRELLEEIKPLDGKLQGEIKEFIFENKDKLKEIGFFHEPGQRIFRVVLKDGFSKTWKTKRKNRKKIFGR